MGDLCRMIWCALIGVFRPRAALEAENLVLRHQLNVLRRKSPKRVALSSIDRLLLVGLYRLAPGVLDALKIIRPETLLRWHRAGFGAFWRWKSRPRGGRPSTRRAGRRNAGRTGVPIPTRPHRLANCVGVLSRSPEQESRAMACPPRLRFLPPLRTRRRALPIRRARFWRQQPIFP